MMKTQGPQKCWCARMAPKVGVIFTRRIYSWFVIFWALPHWPKMFRMRFWLKTKNRNSLFSIEKNISRSFGKKLVTPEVTTKMSKLVGNACLWQKKLNFHFLNSLFSGIYCRLPLVESDLSTSPFLYSFFLLCTQAERVESSQSSVWIETPTRTSFCPKPLAQNRASLAETSGIRNKPSESGIRKKIDCQPFVSSQKLEFQIERSGIWTRAKKVRKTSKFLLLYSQRNITQGFLCLQKTFECWWRQDLMWTFKFCGGRIQCFCALRGSLVHTRCHKNEK